MIGDKRYTEALNGAWIRPGVVVGERCQLRRSGRVTNRGVLTSENADMSSDKTG